MVIKGLISKFAAFLFLLSIFCCCSSQERNETNKILRVQIDTLKSFVDYNNSEVIQPAAIEVLEDGKIAVLDNKLNQVFVFNRTGELKFQFGSEGRGPGEFVHSMYLQKSPNYLNVLDVSQYRINQFDYSGKFVRSFGYTPSKSSRRAFVLEEKQYFSEAMGKNNSLVRLTDAKNDTNFYFGKPMGEYPPNLDLKSNKRVLQRGEIPPMFKNYISMYHSNENLYVFLNSYSHLQKYNSERELIWDKKIDLPVNKRIFKNVVSSAQRNRGSGVPLLIYLHSMKVVNGEIYLLWHSTKEDPQRIIKVDHTGQIEKIFLLPKDHFYGEIAVDKQQNILYVASGNSGKVFRKQL